MPKGLVRDGLAGSGSVSLHLHAIQHRPSFIGGGKHGWHTGDAASAPSPSDPRLDPFEERTLPKVGSTRVPGRTMADAVPKWGEMISETL